MPTGFLVGKECYSTASNAADAFYSQQPVLNSVYTEGSSNLSPRLTLAEYDKTVNGWAVKHQVIRVNTGVQENLTNTLITPKNFPSCEYQSSLNDFSDGVLMGWGVVTAMAVAWGIMAMRRAI